MQKVFVKADLEALENNIEGLIIPNKINIQYCKNHAELCPVCKGTGKVTNQNTYTQSTTIKYENKCHGCNGLGWVIVPGD